MFSNTTRTNRILASLVGLLIIGLVATTAALAGGHGLGGSDATTARPFQLPWAHYASPSGPAGKTPAPHGAPAAIGQLSPWQLGMLGAPVSPLAASPFDRAWIGGSPFARMRAMEQQMDQMFSQLGMGPGMGMPGIGTPGMAMPGMGRPGMTPPVAQLGIDIQDEPQQYVVHVAGGGLADNDVHVELHGRNLTISGQRHSEEQSASPEGNAMQRQERSESFQRLVTLPGPVQEGALDSRVDDGVLVIVIPKAVRGDLT